MSDILRFRGVAEQTGQITPQRRKRRAIERREVARRFGWLGHISARRNAARAQSGGVGEPGKDGRRR